MKYMESNGYELKIGEIKEIVDFNISSVVEVHDDISIDETMKIFESDLNIVIARVKEDGNMVLFDKDILLDVMLKQIDTSKSISEYGSSNYRLMENEFCILNEEYRYIVAYDSANRIKHVLKKTVSRKLADLSDTNYLSVENSMLREQKDCNSEIMINKIIPLKEAKEIVERELIIRAMDIAKTTYKAADILEVSQATVARRYKKYKDENLVDL